MPKDDGSLLVESALLPAGWRLGTAELGGRRQVVLAITLPDMATPGNAARLLSVIAAGIAEGNALTFVWSGQAAEELAEALRPVALEAKHQVHVASLIPPNLRVNGPPRR